MVVDPFMCEIGKRLYVKTGLGFALPCTRSVFILFYLIVGLLFICFFLSFFLSFFIYLSIYLLFFSFAFYEQRFR